MRSPPKRRFYQLEKLLKFIEDLRNVGQMAEGEGNKTGINGNMGICPATVFMCTGEREPARPYIQAGQFQTWYARLRGQKGT
jgi:hypothetical protein